MSAEQHKVSLAIGGGVAASLILLKTLRGAKKTGKSSNPGRNTLHERTVGVVSRNDELVQPGYTLVCAGGGQETLLIDLDGAVVHQWRASFPVYHAYLLPNGNLIRLEEIDRSKPGYGQIEEVTWNNELVWRCGVISCTLS